MALTAFFAFDGFVFATWAVRIPAVKAATGASPAELGVALLGVSSGAIATMALSGMLCRRFGAVRVLLIGAAWLSLALLLPALARSALALGLALVMFGIGYGCVNVAANTVAVDVVGALRRPVMSSFHAAWSLGGLAGAAIGGLLAPRLTPLPHFAIVTALGLAVTIVAGRVLLTTALPAAAAVPAAGDPGAVDEEIGSGTAGSRAAAAGPAAGSAPTAGRVDRARAWRVVLLLGILAACSTYGEGSVTDWGALRLHGLGAGAGLAAIGYAAFALAEACGGSPEPGCSPASGSGPCWSPAGSPPAPGCSARPSRRRFRSSWPGSRWPASGWPTRLRPRCPGSGCWPGRMAWHWRPRSATAASCSGLPRSASCPPPSASARV